MKKLLVALILTSTLSANELYEASPENWSNSEHNWDNSSNDWDNSPHNWDNSPDNIYSDTLIRDNSGDVTGYAVTNDEGTTNIYDLDGNRDGYIYE